MTVAFDENVQVRDPSVIFKFNGEFEGNSAYAYRIKSLFP